MKYQALQLNCRTTKIVNTSAFKRMVFKTGENARGKLTHSAQTPAKGITGQYCRQDLRTVLVITVS